MTEQPPDDLRQFAERLSPDFRVTRDLCIRLQDLLDGGAEGIALIVQGIITVNQLEARIVEIEGQLSGDGPPVEDATAT